MKITCPNCQTKLTLDAGFEGGVCRCSNCGKMLKVPRNRSQKSAIGQPGARPDMPLSPQASGSGSASTSGSSVSAGTGASAGSDSSWLSNTMAAPQPKPTPAPKAQPTPLPSPTNWQPAYIGAGVTVAGVAILLTLVLVVVQSRIGSGPPAATAQPAPAETASRPAVSRPQPTPAKPRPTPAATPRPVRDPNNPFIMTQPNVAGMMLRGHTTILVDAIAASKPWLKDIQAALEAGLSRPAPGTRAQVFYLSDKKLIPANPSALATGPTLAKQLASAASRVAPAGKSGFWTLFGAGTQNKADHIILVTGRTNWKPVLASMQQKLDNAPAKPTFSVINMDASVADLKTFVANNRGQYKSITAAELNRWKREAR